ncbi:putative methylmalonate-semialdehyde dehydrogenase (CoA acylating) [Rosa chinensis]|uniref:Putative methylmalonate-semialdehyde dehydrogenase (CoA acylating) n=1 Tax=Rosa chinensis TaxID=74649 RepID=A0A2P6PQP7_ROSCH|nr:putative methylmalonate-semialdehyde dehydrogenase (CoA acylating) [Rosa chinensis]
MNCDGQLNKNNLARKVKYILYQFVTNFEYETGWYQRSNSSNKASFAGDLNLYGKAGVNFFTQIKTVTLQWKNLPGRLCS